MKRIVLFSLVAFLILGLGGGVARASHTMRWDFQLMNNPNARQVALNIANAQQELLKTTEEESGLDRFKESLDRMAMSKAIRDIVYYEPGSEEEPPYGFVPVDDGWIYYAWDPASGSMKIYYYSDGNWTDISIEYDETPSKPF